MLFVGLQQVSCHWDSGVRAMQRKWIWCKYVEIPLGDTLWVELGLTAVLTHFWVWNPKVICVFLDHVKIRFWTLGSPLVQRILYRIDVYWQWLTKDVFFFFDLRTFINTIALSVNFTHINVCLCRKSVGFVMAPEQVMNKVAVIVTAKEERGTVRLTTSLNIFLEHTFEMAVLIIDTPISRCVFTT